MITAIGGISSGVNQLTGFDPVGDTIGGITNLVDGFLGGNRDDLRDNRDQVKQAILALGVDRSSWRNFNSDSVPAGKDLYRFLQANTGAIEFMNQYGIGDINRSDVDSFIMKYNNWKALNHNSGNTGGSTAQPGGSASPGGASSPGGMKLLVFGGLGFGIAKMMGWI